MFPNILCTVGQNELGRCCGREPEQLVRGALQAAPAGMKGAVREQRMPMLPEPPGQLPNTWMAVGAVVFFE